jgi:hypothetical protein
MDSGDGGREAVNDPLLMLRADLYRDVFSWLDGQPWNGHTASQSPPPSFPASWP